MYRTFLRSWFAVALSILVIFVPFAADASKLANAMCNPVIPACPCGTVPSNSICVTGSNWYMCPDHCKDVEPGGTVFGQCVAPDDCKMTHAVDASGNAVPMVKQAPSLLDRIGSFMSKNPLITTAIMTVGTTLLSSLMSNSGSSKSSGGSATTGICTTSYYYSANPNSADPCAVYSQNGQSPSTVLPTTGTSDTNLQSLLPTSPATPLLASTTSGSLINNGASNVTTCSDGSSCTTGYYCSTIVAGQCIPAGKVDCGSYWCESGNSCATDSSMQCVPSGSNTSSNLYNDTTSSTTPPASQTDLNQKNIPVPSDGLHGDLISFGGGVTIYGQSVSGNTTVSGFYGSSGSGGGLCQSRPWASNFLSYIIPPGFFDSLCNMAGFPTITQVPSGFAGSSGIQMVKGPGSPASPSLIGQSSTAAQATIAASPPNVNIGGRTTVFWTSRNVTSCEETSSDGNFSGTSLSGGASTVALSGPVTFNISCLGLDGTQVHNSVTVNIGI